MPAIPSPEEYEAYIRKNETWNFVVNILDLTFYNLALSFIYSSTIMSLYASYLTSTAALIGLIPAIQSVGFFLPQLVLAQRSERALRKKPIVQKISVMERLPYLFIALGILFWPDAPKPLSYAILALGMTVAMFSGGLAGPAWNGMLAKVIPVHRRGLFFGLSHATGGLLGIAGAALSRHILSTYPFPTAFGLSFLLCFFSQVLSWIALTLNREPAKEPAVEALSGRDYLRKLPRLLRAHPNFCRYLLSRTLIIIGTMGTAFYVVYAHKTFPVGPAFAANLTIAALVSQTLFTPLLGRLADRWGHKWLTELSAVCGGTALILVLLAPNAIWFYAVFMVMNIATSGMFVAGLSIIMEMAEPDELPTFAALANTILAVPILLSPILGGWLADALGYRPLFAVALCFAMLGWGTMRWMVREPRHERQEREAAASAP